MTRPNRLHRTVAGGSITAFAMMLASTQLAHAATGYTESLKVDAGGARSAKTSANLIAGHSYRIDVTGTYAANGVSADAECSTSDVDRIYMPARGGSSAYDLLVNGREIAWKPVHPDLFECDSTTHQYSFSLTPTTDGPVEFGLNIPSSSADAHGTLDVQVTGDAATSASSASPATARPTPSYAPSSESAPPPRSPAPAPPARTATLASESTAPTQPRSTAAESADTQATVADLLGTPERQQSSIVMAAPAARERNNVLPDYGTGGGAQPGSVIVLSLAALMAAAAASSPVRNRILAAAGGIDELSVTRRQTAHRVTEMSAVAPPKVAARRIPPRPTLKRGARSALAHRSASMTNQVATIIVNDLPSTRIAASAACDCGYCG